MYNLIIYLYLLGVAIYSRFNPKVRKMWRGERDAFRILREKVDPQAKYVWFHAASLGEFEQGATSLIFRSSVLFMSESSISVMFDVKPNAFSIR